MFFSTFVRRHFEELSSSERIIFRKDQWREKKQGPVKVQQGEQIKEEEIVNIQRTRKQDNLELGQEKERRV